jgi:hypothetical protein
MRSVEPFAALVGGYVHILEQGSVFAGEDSRSRRSAVRAGRNGPRQLGGSCAVVQPQDGCTSKMVTWRCRVTFGETKNEPWRCPVRSAPRFVTSVSSAFNKSSHADHAVGQRLARVRHVRHINGAVVAATLAGCAPAVKSPAAAKKSPHRQKKKSRLNFINDFDAKPTGSILTSRNWRAFKTHNGSARSTRP